MNHQTRVYENVFEMLPGEENPSPMVRINRLNPSRDFPLYAKLEWMNPFGSVKDRAAWQMLRDLEERGEIGGPRGIVEPTSGNTGISLAAMARARGYHLRAVVPNKIPLEKKVLLKIVGADLDVISDELCPAPGLGEGSINLAKTHAKAQAHKYAMPNQYENAKNVEAHVNTTGPEIWRQTEGKITHLFVSLGTCGTVTGTSKFLRQKNSNVKVIAVQPTEGHDVPGLRNVAQLGSCKLFDASLIDDILEIDFRLAYTRALDLCQNEGLLAGPSSGLIFEGALEVVQREKKGLGVMIFPDNIFKYTSNMMKHIPAWPPGRRLETETNHEWTRIDTNQSTADHGKCGQPIFPATVSGMARSEQIRVHSCPFVVKNRKEAEPMARYAIPETLIETDWVKANLGRPGIKLVEIDVDTKAYDAGHIPGAVGFNWQTQLQDQVKRDIISKEAFENLVGGAGISPGDTVICYGDNNNWFAAYGFWLFKIYGHEEVRLMNGGRVKWLNEQDKTLTTDVPKVTPVPYKVTQVNLELRAFVPQVFEASKGREWNLVDVRSPDEFTGKVIAPPGMTETAQRGGHIPGAKSIPWSTAVNPDGTFKSPEDLQRIYCQEKGVDPQKDTIAYCRIGERSSHTWFVLKYLIGINNVKNYDGSWTEYGNLVAAPIEKS